MTENFKYNKKPCSVTKEFFGDETMPWHIHTQYELVYLSIKDGVKQVGNHWSPVKSDELLLIAPNMPHYWTANDTPAVKYHISIRFDNNIFGGGNLFRYSPFAGIQSLLKKAEQGICFKEKIAIRFKSIFESMLHIDEFDQSLELIRMLNRLSAEENYDSLSTFSYGAANSIQDQSKRMTDVINYITLHYKENISLKEIAEVANMTPQAFCKYFKEATKKTFVEFVNEIRLSYACKLMFDVNYNISQICYESGFNSLTNFNRQFRKVTNMSPIAYRAQVFSSAPAIAI